jgi:hypothetical protein
LQTHFASDVSSLRLHVIDKYQRVARDKLEFSRMRGCVFLACMVLAACDTGIAPMSDASALYDLTVVDELAPRIDMAGRDMTGADLSQASPPDLAITPDLSQAPSRDLAIAPDLSRFDAGKLIGTQLAFQSSVVGTISSGQTENIVVDVTDVHGDIDPSATPTVTLSLDGTTTLATTDAVAGVATFSGVALLPAGSHTLTASAPMLAPATSASFSIRYSRAHFLSQPISTTDAAAWSPPAQFELVDELGTRDVAAQGGGSGFYSWELFMNSLGTPSEPTATGAVNGVVTFPNAPRTIGDQQTMEISVFTTYSVKHTITSDPFDITLGPPTRFSSGVLRFPRNLPRHPFAVLETAGFNLAFTSGVDVTLTPGQPPGPFVAETESTLNGIALFALYTSADRADYSVTFSAPGLTSSAQTISFADFGNLSWSGTTYMNFVAADASNGSRIFMSDGSTFAVSTDGGETISSMQTFPLSVGAIAPSSPLVGYAAFLAKDGTLQVSSTTDGGMTWTAGASVSEAQGVGRIDVSPLNANELVLVWAGSVYRSTDGGATLTRMLGEVNANDSWSVARAPSAPNVLYAAEAISSTEYPPPVAPLYTSTDGGATWTALTKPSSFSISSLCVDAASSQRVYVTPGHLRTDDGFATVTSIGPSDYSDDQAPITCHPTHGGVVYAYGLLSQDAGATFNAWSDTSLGSTTITYIVPGSPNLMFTSYSMTAMGIP